MRLIRNAFAVIAQHKKAVIALNAASDGALVIGMFVTAIFPELQENAMQRVDAQLDQSGLGQAIVAAYYGNVNPPLAAGLTFLVNLVLGSFLTTTAPSLVVPFFGIAFSLYRAVEWGVLFAPIGPDAASLIPHYLTVLIEGQAYVIAAFATWVHGRLFLQPRRFGLASRGAGYRAGLLATARLYPLIIIVLLVGAIYEAVEVIYVMPLFE